MAFTKQIDFPVDLDVFTSGAVAEIVSALLEFLLYQRNQLPFVYKTYRNYVNLWAEAANEEQNTTSTLCRMQLERQREQAKQTKEAISAMRELIKQAFDQNAVKCVRFLFGATGFTPKEAYTIHIPTEFIESKHFYTNHFMSTMSLNQALLTLLTNHDLYALFSNNLNTTNVFMELEWLEPTTQYNGKKLLPKYTTKLPTYCKDIHIHLLQASDKDLDRNILNCCSKLEVFSELKNLNINANYDEQKEQINNEICATANKPNWWEADIIIRGFKEKPIKGLNLWTE